MLGFKNGDRVILPATDELPIQKATVIEVQDGGPNSDLLTVRIDESDRESDDDDGLTEVDELAVERI